MSENKHLYDLTEAYKLASTHIIQLRMIPEGSLVLDAGCHSGAFGALVRERKGCRVIGIDIDAEPLAEAATRLDDAFVVNIETSGWAATVREHGYDRFDVILFGDILEHTRDPLTILKEARSLLKPDGRIIVSIPNVAYWRTRFALLAGKFDYTDWGILDKTHLRFYTRATARELIASAGYELIEQDMAGYTLPQWLLRKFPGLLGVQYVCAARLKNLR